MASEPPASRLDVALSLANAGWHVFPVRNDGSKRPLVLWDAAATREPAVIAETWTIDHPDALIGVHAGKSGLHIVDVDEKDGKSGSANLRAAGLVLPPTLSYATPSGGRHHVYRAPAGDLTIAQNYPVEAVDIRAGVGYVVYYGEALSGDECIADAPEFTVKRKARESRSKAGGSTRADTSDWLARLTPGKPSKPVKKSLKSVSTAGMSHANMLEAAAELVRLGVQGEPGVAHALERAEARYSDDYPPEYRKAWRDAVTGSIKRQGMPPTTFEMTRDEKGEILRRNAQGPSGMSVSRRDRRAALKAAQKTFRRWLGGDYDLDTLRIVLAAAAVEKLDGDPLWLLIVGGPGGAKTETGMALAGSGARVVSSIASAGSLLSATSKGERSKDATGGLLREIGDRGLLFIKDFTTLMSANANVRAEVFAALREIYDGYWVRDVGTDGGRSLPWTGRLIVIGAVTTEWDAKHAAIAAMGDRFALVRIDQSGRLSAGRQALANVGRERDMRRELDDAMTGVLARVDVTKPPAITRVEDDALLAAADLVTRARTAVESDYQGRPVEAHAAESPTRFAKQLAQVLRGAVAVGVKRNKALALAMRVARDSMPPKRLLVLDDVAKHPRSSVTDVRKRLQQPHASIDRTLQTLLLLGLVRLDEEPSVNGTRWFYTVARDVDLTAIGSQPTDLFNRTTSTKKAK